MNTLKSAIILLIDDDPKLLLLLKQLLVGKCKELLLNNDPELGLRLAREKQPDLILLDIMIGRASGYDICKQLKTDKQTEHIPVIFLSSLMRATDKVKAFEAGGVDYISKPFALSEVLVRLESCLITHKKIYQAALEYLPENISDVLEQFQLKNREIEVLSLYLSGYKRIDIATKIHLSENTVKWYLKKIFQKLEVDSRAALMEKIQTSKL